VTETGSGEDTMAEIMPGVHVVDGVGMPGRPGTVNVCLLVDKDECTLIDAGFPGVGQPLSAALASLGMPPTSVRRIIVTHHHFDHTGGLAEAVRLTGAEVWAHTADAGFIDGSVPRAVPAWVREGTGAPAATASAMKPEPVAVTLRLVGGEELGVLGGIRILHTPGHTPGHLSLLLPELSLLIAGDALRYEDGMVGGAPEHYNADTARAHETIRELIALDFEHMLPYHGDHLSAEASTKARADLAATP
jgi:glyoxylase-like metal-dependent hydrolase (beta-lactamase superfamily II)